jgi:serine/threonine-protein kinase
MIDVGSTIGNYVVKQKIGEGGMGFVFLAEHPLIGRRMAIKVIHPTYASNAEAVSRFFTEAQAVNKIGHQNIVDVTDFGQTPDGECYFVMEFLSGHALSDLLKQGLPNLQIAFHIASQIADALSASHEAGILHRDLKPDNVYLIGRGADRNFVKVLDFGLAKLTTGDAKASHKTRAGTVMGTPYYMAPEQCAGKPDIDGRADIYALGVILFEMVTGQVPFSGEGYGEVIVKHMTSPVPSVRQLNPNCPDWVETLIMGMLAKEPGTRYQTMAQVRDLILTGMQTGSLTATPGQATVAMQPLGSAPSYPRMGSSIPGVVANPISTLGLSAGESSVIPPKPKRTGIMIVGGALALGAAAGIFFAVNGGSKKASSAEPAAAPQPDPTQSVAAAPAPPPTPTAPTRIVIHLTTTPDDAEIIVDGATIGHTPFDWSTDKSDQIRVVTFRHAGFDDKQKTITLSADGSIDTDLVATKPVAAVTPPTAPTTPPPVQHQQPVMKQQPQTPVVKPNKPAGGQPDDDLMAPGSVK